MAQLNAATAGDYRRISVMMAGGKGGVCKTTTSAQILDNAARLGLRCIGFDLDANGGLSTLTGTVPPMGQVSIKEVLEGTVAPREAAAVPGGWQPDESEPWIRGGALIPGGCVHMVPAPQKHLGMITNRSGLQAETSLLRAITESGLGEEYDLIVIDAAGAEGPAMNVGMHAAGQLMFPLQTEPLAHRGMIRTIEAAIEFAGVMGKSVNGLGVNPTRYKTVREHRLTLEASGMELQDKFGGQIPMLPVIPERTVVTEASSYQVPVSRMVTRGGTNAPIAAAYARTALPVLAAVLPEDRYAAILDAISGEDLSDEVREVLFASNIDIAGFGDEVLAELTEVEG